MAQRVRHPINKKKKKFHKSIFFSLAQLTLEGEQIVNQQSNHLSSHIYGNELHFVFFWPQIQ